MCSYYFSTSFDQLSTYRKKHIIYCYKHTITHVIISYHIYSDMPLVKSPQIKSSLIQKFGVFYPCDGPVWRYSLGKLPLESVPVIKAYV